MGVNSVKEKIEVPVEYVAIRLYAHATEDENKVLEAVKNLFPGEYAEEITFKETKLRGHHGNPIILFETRVTKKKIVRSLIERIVSNLKPIDKEELARKIDLHLQDGDLYIRLDKQRAYRGEIAFSNVDPIWIKIRFRRGARSNMIEACRRMGLIP